MIMLDISFVMNLISQFTLSFHANYLCAVQHIFHYFQGTVKSKSCIVLIIILIILYIVFRLLYFILYIFQVKH